MDITIIKCPHCGKEFVYNPLSIYKLRKGKGNSRKLVWYCSYTCWKANDDRRYNFEEGRYSRT